VFGADEEVGGHRGAEPIAKLLQQRGARFAFVVDEGLLITEGVMPGIRQPAALVGLTEKGSISLALRTEAATGHSSMPPAPGQGAVARLAKALAQVDAHPMPGAIDGVAGEMFATVAPEFSGFQRVALSNLWLLGPVVQAQLEKGQATNAMLRTTTALTMLRGGVKENVLAGAAEGVVNFRIKPGDTRESVTQHVRDVVADPQVKIEALPGSFEASRVASTQSMGYQAINRTLREVAPDVIVAPGLMLGGTDSRHFSALSDQIFKFSPIRAKPEDLARFHGTNERISVTSLVEMIRFYHRLIQQSAGPLTAQPAPQEPS
jgi:carboxypeptidase PM20D1